MDRWDLTVALHRPVIAGPVVLRGAEEYLVQQVVGLVAGDGPPLVHSVVRDPGTVTITFVDWAVGSPELAASLLAIGYRGELELRVLIARTPELFGWTVEVTATPSTPPVPGADRATTRSRARTSTATPVTCSAPRTGSGRSPCPP